jgi:hypothetical protein
MAAAMASQLLNNTPICHDQLGFARLAPVLEMYSTAAREDV